jgi:hypothetical protein
MHRSKRALLFDHFVGVQQERFWNGEADRFRGFDVDDQLKLGWPLNRQITRLGAFEQPTDQECAAPRPEPARMRPCHQCHRLHAHAPWLA